MADCCREATKVSKIKLDDEGSEHTATFINTGRLKHLKIRVDGCLVKQALAADWILSKPEVGHIVVELKGSDVDHAVKQVLETAKLAKKMQGPDEKIAGLIACTRYPRIDTKIQRGKQEFSNKYSGRLYIVARSGEYYVEKLLNGD
jgi:hypothetical protein